MTIATWLRRRQRDVPRAAARAVCFHSEGRSHVGRVRTVNEDRLFERADRGLWAVADGMGGHSGGAAAAGKVVALLDDLANDPASIDPARVQAALEHANRAIHGAGHGVGSGDATSGTTVVVAMIRGATATIFWAGDSRAYRIRGGKAECLTRDHSIVQELIDAGLLGEAAAARHPQANVVTRALGVAPTIVVESVTIAVAPGDRLLLCSDGVSRSLAWRDFATSPMALGDSADRFLANALQRDGGDNATLVVIETV